VDTGRVGIMGAAKSFHKRSRAEKFEYRTEARGDHLLERISRIEDTIWKLHRPRCPCGSQETLNRVQLVGNNYAYTEMRCFYCFRILEAYGAMGR